MSAGGGAAVLDDLREGVPPAADGWGWLYRAFDAVAGRTGALRRILCGYFLPTGLELADGGRLYRLLGVAAFGRFIPTGGVEIRRATHSRMASYTLAGTSLRGARDFYFRACVFEALHMPFFLALVGLAIHRASIGRLDWAIQETVMNLAVNLYPMMHHRHTRTRIVALLSRRARRDRAGIGVPRVSGRRSVRLCLPFLLAALLCSSSCGAPGQAGAPRSAAVSDDSAALTGNPPAADEEAAAPADPAEPRPVVPFVREDACPFEGCQFGRWYAGTPLTAFRAEGDTDSVAFTIAAGDSFTARAGNVHLERFGIVVVKQPVRGFSPGDTLLVLGLEGEAGFSVWFADSMRTEEMFWDVPESVSPGDMMTVDSTEDSRAVMTVAPLMVWWVAVSDDHGRDGWLRLVNRTQFGFRLDERIGGMDAFE